MFFSRLTGENKTPASFGVGDWSKVWFALSLSAVVRLGRKRNEEGHNSETENVEGVAADRVTCSSGTAVVQACWICAALTELRQ